MATYVKLFGSLLDSTVWSEPPPIKIVWITMLAMADRDGIVEASVPGLAKRAGVSRVECEKALELFSSPDPDSRTKDNQGRRIKEVDGGWTILNYEKYRDKATTEEARQKNAERQKRWRERNASVTLVTPVDQNNVLSSSVPAAAAAAAVTVSTSVQGVPSGTHVQGYHKDSRTVLHLLNEATGKKFRETSTNLEFISARLKEPGVDLAGVRIMINRQCDRWKGTTQDEYLRPETLFNKTKFDGYYAARELAISVDQQPKPKSLIDKEIDRL